METKAEIRKRILEVRKGLTDEEAATKSEAIVQKVVKTPEYKEADNILLYADYCREVMTAVFLRTPSCIEKGFIFQKWTK